MLLLNIAISCLLQNATLLLVFSLHLPRNLRDHLTSFHLCPRDLRQKTYLQPPSSLLVYTDLFNLHKQRTRRSKAMRKDTPPCLSGECMLRALSKLIVYRGRMNSMASWYILREYYIISLQSIIVFRSGNSIFFFVCYVFSMHAKHPDSGIVLPSFSYWCFSCFSMGFNSLW